MRQAFEAVRREADKLGVEVTNTEIVGLVPEDALDKDAEYFQKLENFTEDKVLESAQYSLVTARPRPPSGAPMF